MSAANPNPPSRSIPSATAARERARGYYDQATELRREAELASLPQRRAVLLDAATRLILLAKLEMRGAVSALAENA